MPNPAAEKIQSNGKALLNDALPGDAGGNVFTLREDHRYGRHIPYLTAHMEELGAEHNLGTLGFEQPPYMMAFGWAYRDAAPGPKKDAAREALLNAYEGYSANRRIGRQRGELAVAAIDQGVEVICFDGRFSLAQSYQDEKRGIRALQRQKPEDFADLSGEESFCWTLNAAKTLYANHPEYKSKLQQVEQAVATMEKKKIPMDIICATVVTQMGNATKNMLTISGLAHLSGGSVPEMNVQGIFDEGLAHAPIGENGHWRVTDGFMGTEKGIRLTAYGDHERTKNYDRMDYLWAIDTDEVATRRIVDGKQTIVSTSASLRSQMPEFDPSSKRAPLPEDLYTEAKLNPTLIPELQDVIAPLKPAPAAAPSIPPVQTGRLSSPPSLAVPPLPIDDPLATLESPLPTAWVPLNAAPTPPIVAEETEEETVAINGTATTEQAPIPAQYPNGISANGKEILNDALPGDQGGNVLALRESHRYTKHLDYLAEHMQELKAEHRVGTLGIEMGSYMMGFHWAYRDAAPGAAKEAAGQALRDAYADYYQDFPRLGERQAQLVLAAVDQGIEVTCFDSRGSLAEDAGESYGIAAERVYRAHPEYRAKINAIERAAETMKQQGIPMEVVFSTILSRSADPTQNMIAIAGYNHINGTHLRQDANYRSDGIFDEGLAHAPTENGATWRVTDGFMGTPKSIRYMAESPNPGCSTQDQIDFIWSVTTDEMVLWRATDEGQWQLLSNSDALTKKLQGFDPGADAPFAEDVFGNKLEPHTIEAVQQTVEDLQRAFQAPAAPAIAQTEKAPDRSRG